MFLFCFIFVSWFVLFGIASVYFLFGCCDKFADVVAVLIDDVVYDCL